MITNRQVHALITAGEARAKELAIVVNIAVLDAGAQLKAFSRMDRAVLGSIDLAMSKARTAVLFQIPSEAVWEYCKPGAPAHALEHSSGGLTPFAGVAAQVSHRQPGDPRKLAAAVVRLAASPKPPVHLPLGKDTLAGYRAKIASFDQEIADWHDVVTGTDHDDVAPRKSFG